MHPTSRVALLLLALPVLTAACSSTPSHSPAASPMSPRTPTAAAPVTVTPAAAALPTAASKSATAASSTPAAVVLPAPNLGVVVPAGYTLMSVRPATLDREHPGQGRIVISHGADRGPLSANDGGTEDVQLLVYDPALARWNLTFDAHTMTVYPGLSTSDYDTGDAHAVLPAADPVTDAAASIIQVAPGQEDLLLSATDSSTEDASVERVACIGFADGVATLAYYSAVPNGTPPQLTGTPDHREFRLSAPYVSSVDAMAYPVRTYTQTIGYSGGHVRVITDDRPGIGLSIAVFNGPDSPDTNPVVVAVQPGSPAARAGIKPGDDLLNILPSIHRADSGNEQPAIIDELAAHRVGDHLTVYLYREDQQVTVHLTPVMIEKTVATPGSTPPTPAVIGVTINPDSPTLGATIASVDPNSPAALGGLVSGDTITAIGAMPVIDADTCQDGLLGTASELVDVTVTAPNGATDTLRLTPDPASTDNTDEPTAYLM